MKAFIGRRAAPSGRRASTAKCATGRRRSTSSGSRSGDSSPPLNPDLPLRFGQLPADQYLAVCAQCHAQSAIHDADAAGNVNYSDQDRRSSAHIRRISHRTSRAGRSSGTDVIAPRRSSSRRSRDRNAFARAMPRAARATIRIRPTPRPIQPRSSFVTILIGCASSAIRRSSSVLSNTRGTRPAPRQAAACRVTCLVSWTHSFSRRAP